jgi:Zn-dependent membrane protease YugP
MWLDQLIFLAPAVIISMLAAVYTRTTFAKYSRIAASSGCTGAQAARQLLTSQGIHNVTIEQVRGFLSDHYDPTSRKLRLSPDVYCSNSLSAIGVACHEAGHAIQHAQGYAALGLRSTLVPAASIGSHLGPLLIMIGIPLGMMGLTKIGIILFGAAVFFSIVTLPVEWNASARAKVLMVSAGIVSYREQAQAGKVLNAAFLTYVAGALTAVMQLVFFLLRAGLLGGRRND